MSITTEITRIKGNIAAAYTALTEKGATMPAAQNSANLANTIENIPLSAGSDTYTTDLVLLGVVEGLPQPAEDTIVTNAISILQGV